MSKNRRSKVSPPNAHKKAAASTTAQLKYNSLITNILWSHRDPYPGYVSLGCVFPVKNFSIADRLSSARRDLNSVTQLLTVVTISRAVFRAAFVGFAFRSLMAFTDFFTTFISALFDIALTLLVLDPLSKTTSN